MRVEVLIADSDVTANLLERDWEYGRSDGAGLDSAIFTFDDPLRQFDPKRGQEVLIRDVVGKAARWGGVVTEVVMTTFGLGRRVQVRAEDWKFVFDRSVVTDNFRNQTAKQIIAVAFDAQHAVLTEFDVDTFVSDGETVISLAAQDMSILLLLENLAEKNGFELGVTPDKKLIFRERDAQSSGITFSDDGENTAYESLLLQRPPGGLINTVIVHGGLIPITEEDETKEFRNDGEEPFIDIGQWGPPNGEDRITVERNTGSEGSPTWTVQDLGILGTDQLTGDGGDKDVLLSADGRLLWDTAPSDFSNAFRVTGRLLQPLIHTKQDLESVEALGRPYTVVINDRNIRDPSEAIARAEERFNREKKPRRVRFSTLNEDLTPGQTFHMIDHRLNIDEEFICTDIKVRLIGATVARTNVTGELVAQRPDEWTVVT